MKKVLIIGGGPAGMMAAIAAARQGCEVVLFEKNEKLGKKLYITGKGRCNITNASDVESLLDHIMTNKKFLYHAFYAFDSDALIRFFAELGLKTKVERGNRVFPRSDKSSDVIKALQDEMQRLGIKIYYQTSIHSIAIKDNAFWGLNLEKSGFYKGDAVIIATGGLSYPTTGSTGDGYTFAKGIGHKIRPTSPSIVPMNIKEDWVKDLQGLSLRNVGLKVFSDNKMIYQAFGEMLFTHFGVTGPLILSASRYSLPYLKNTLTLSIDLKPALDLSTLDKRLLKDFNSNTRKQFKNALDDLLPKKLISVIIQLSKINPEKRIDQISKRERLDLVHLLKNLQLTVTGFRGYKEAVITYGGVDVKKVNPMTMESKLVKNIYFAGEVLDIDALTGGYNLQVAFSTGYLAGSSVVE